MNSPNSTRVLVPAGMLGGGFPEATVRRGIELGAHAIAVDAGSTDSGPYYLGAATPKTSAAAVRRDLAVLLNAAVEAGIPLVVGSCGTSGTDAGVDLVADMVAGLAAELPAGAGRDLRVACLYSEQDPGELIARLQAGRIRALAPAAQLDESDLRRCTHIVGLLGHLPYLAALEAGADVILGGRSTDSAVIAAAALWRGCAPGPAWHAGKVAECGGLCTTAPHLGGVLVDIDSSGFTVVPLAERARATPQSVAAHMLYENAHPSRLAEPGGVLDASNATYAALDDRRVRVAGSAFEPVPLTMKLEGSAIVGYQTISIVGIRDPETLARIDDWLTLLKRRIDAGIQSRIGLSPGQYRIELRAYGHNAVLGPLEPDRTPPREVGVVLLVTAADQQTATQIARLANPALLHLPLPGQRHLPTFAFLTSPAETERGEVYEFVLQHVVEVDSGTDLVRIEWLTLATKVPEAAR